MMNSGEKIRIFDIQRFSLHDGPGIRTTVFFKGCHMYCPWCANPESQSGKTELMYFERECAHCGECAAMCPAGAVDFSSGTPVFDRKKCTACGECADACVRSALKLTGELKTADEIMNVVMRDKDYYSNTGGGLTLSGGEVLCQAHGAKSLLKKAKKERLHTALETTASVPYEDFDRVIPYTDLFLIDMKFAEAEKLKTVTGGDLKRILRNLQKAAEHSDVIVRVPIIPEYNDTKEEISEIFRIIKSCGVQKADLLAYHLLGKSKYTQLGREYPCKEIEALSKEQLEPFKNLGINMGLSVSIGGK